MKILGNTGGKRTITNNPDTAKGLAVGNSCGDKGQLCEGEFQGSVGGLQEDAVLGIMVWD